MQRERTGPTNAGTRDADVLLVTSTLRPENIVPYVALRDPRERLFQTLCSLVAWVDLTPLRRFVVCDSSGASGNLGKIARYAQEQGKEMELIEFIGDNRRVALQGKGYGEGEIVARALHHSALLRECASFYKITGRTFVRNFNPLHARHARDPVVFALGGRPWKSRLRGRLASIPFFLRRWENRTVATIFYKSSPVFFRTQLIDRYREVDDRQGRWLEHAYYVPSMRNGVTFSSEPIIVGVSGSSGGRYSLHPYPDDVQARARALM